MQPRLTPNIVRPKGRGKIPQMTVRQFTPSGDAAEWHPGTPRPSYRREKARTVPPRTRNAPETRCARRTLVRVNAAPARPATSA